jgi:uncharacterized membrane protein
MTAEHVAIFSIILCAGSELIALNPTLKSNSWVQLIIKGLQDILSKKAPKE